PGACTQARAETAHLVGDLAVVGDADAVHPARYFEGLLGLGAPRERIELDPRRLIERVRDMLERGLGQCAARGDLAELVDRCLQRLDGCRRRRKPRADPGELLPCESQLEPHAFDALAYRVLLEPQRRRIRAAADETGHARANDRALGVPDYKAAAVAAAQELLARGPPRRELQIERLAECVFG